MCACPELFDGLQCARPEVLDGLQCASPELLLDSSARTLNCLMDCSACAPNCLIDWSERTPSCLIEWSGHAPSCLIDWSARAQKECGIDRKTYRFSIQCPDGVVQVVFTRGVAVSIASCRLTTNCLGISFTGNLADRPVQHVCTLLSDHTETC